MEKTQSPVEASESKKPNAAKPGPSKKGKFTPFTQFPTPNLLAAAQREYAAQGLTHKNEDDSGVPAPFPPPTSKKEAFNPDDYFGLDKHATNVPNKVSTGSLKGLVDYLVAECTTDMEKVRCFFVWIASQDDSEHQIIYDTTVDNALNKAMMARANCYSYNKLFENMCSLADVNCSVVEGAAKGYENEDAEEFALDTHHWCMVYVDNAWRLVDQCFGSEYMVRDMADWEVENAEKEMTEKASERMHYVGEEHFLTDPELFIYKHFPAEPESQLLARPLTHQEFNKMAVFNKSYFDFEIQDLSEPKGRIETKNGEIKLWFKTKPGRDLTMSFALFKHFHDKSGKKAEKSLNELVRLETKDGKKEFWLHFRQLGIYKLQVLVREKVTSPFRELVKYVINCISPYFPDVDNPLLSQALQEIGPGAAWKELGIKAGEKGILKAVEGNAKLLLRGTKDIVFSFHLKKDDTNEPISQCILLETANEETTLHIKLPSHGTYLLKIFTGKKGDESLQHTCNFLIESDMRCITAKFPKVFTAVGAVNDCALLKPLQGGAYVRLSGTLDDFVIEAEILEPASYLIKLALWDGDKETDLSEFACYEIIESKLRILLRFKHAGDYLLRIFTKTNPEDAAFALSWKYLLEVENPTHEYQAYPEKLKDWRPDVLLRKPKYMFLGQSMDYDFDVEVPGAKKVKVMKIGEQKTYNLKKSGSHFTGKVNTLVEQAQLVLYAEDTNDAVQQFYKFDIINSNRIGEMEVEYHLHEGEAATQQMQLEEELEQEKQAATERKKQAMQSEAERKKEFEVNKDELLENMAALEEKAKEVQFRAKLKSFKIQTSTIRDMVDQMGTDKNSHSVVIAAMLLLGRSEKKTADPAKCRETCINIGDQKIVNLMMSFKPNTVHPEIMARVKQVLRQINWLILKGGNPGAAKVFDWVKEVTEAYKGDVSVKAAGPEKQKIIFSQKPGEKQ